MKKELNDVVIIGGGAAGLCTAVALKQLNRSLSVIIAEQMPRVGKKLITTGNGRCNITNRTIDISRYHSQNIDFAKNVLDRFDGSHTENFFSEIGVVITYDDSGRAYPYSLQASSVVDALRFATDDMGVKTMLEAKVTAIKKVGGIYEVATQQTVIRAKCVVIASGLYSGGEKLGSGGSVFEMLKHSGYKTVKTTPAIVQIRTGGTVAKSLKGIKVNAAATLLAEGKKIRSDFGEVLFCDYGLSGPPIMQISREVERTSGNKTISLDLMPDYSFDKIIDMLKFRSTVLKDRTLEEFFGGMLNKRVGQAVVKLSSKRLCDGIATLNGTDFKKMAAIIKNMSFEVTGTTGFDNSQVTAGGIDTREFNPHNMMSYRDEALFAVGEVLDVDGDCGGFNLQWAWSSALCAANGIIEYLG